jgi:DNA repair protein RecO (recombination protein O)
MDQRTTGIVLRTRPLTETSLIVHWITPDLGRIGTVAKGARRPKSPLRGKLDLFFSAEFSFARSRRSDLHTLKEVELRASRPAFRHDLAGLQRAAYATALLEQVTETETPIVELFALFEGFLDELNLRPYGNDLVLAFEFKLLQELGLAPDLAEARLSEGSRQIAGRLGTLPWAELKILKANPGQERELREFLFRFLGQHLGRVPRGRAQALALPES